MTKDLSRGSNAVRSVFAILDRESEIDPENLWQIDAMKNDVRGRVELRNVFFAYPSRADQLILKGSTSKLDQEPLLN
ncbi:multidrug resistance [Olea europaea subsp. europaea]|uniref:Multidrug resistance n=1 Tax=Olea europaea subsp. europaea TaxID=158383 RepID=A0A8S0SB61_OLEEU|nr:multidrug resistance [Olea europaea subsp. europaea]